MAQRFSRIAFVVLVVLGLIGFGPELVYGPLDAQAGQPNGRQFNVTVTNAAVVQLTVPAGTTFCTIAVTTNPINYDVGSSATSAAPTTTTGISAQAGAVIQLGSFTLCRNWGAIAQAGNATLNALYFR